MATQQQENQKSPSDAKPSNIKKTSQSPEMALVDDLTEYFSQYAKQRPGMVALWSLGIGFVIGWKLKPW